MVNWQCCDDTTPDLIKTGHGGSWKPRKGQLKQYISNILSRLFISGYYKRTLVTDLLFPEQS